MKTSQNRWNNFLLMELGIAVALLLFVCFETKSPRARTSLAAPLASTSTEPDTVEETVTLKPSTPGLKTWSHYDHAYPSNTTHWPCGLSSRGLGGSAPRAGEMLVGYEHFFDEGTKPFPCQERIDHWYRGTVWFDVSDIVAKAPPLKVFVESATLNFKPISKVCRGQLLIATEDWVKGSPADLVAGDPFSVIAALCESRGCSFEVGRVVNNWVRGAEHDGYANFGFVLRGNNETNSEDNDSCLSRYGDFSLKVTYKYDRTPIFPTETPTPTKVIAAGRSRPDLSLAPTNFALASNGATATAQNYTQDSAYPGSHFQPSYAIDGKRYLHLVTPPPNDADGFWRDEHGLPSWLQVDFSGTKTISDVVLYTVPDYPDYLEQVDPSRGLMFKTYGVTAFDVMYWTGSAWAIVPGGSITGNTYVLTHLKFSPAIKTSKIRIVVKAAPDNIARIAEIEAYPVSSSTIGPL